METFKAKPPPKSTDFQAITVRIDKETYSDLVKLAKLDKCKNVSQFTKQLIDWLVKNRKGELSK